MKDLQYFVGEKNKTQTTQLTGNQNTAFGTKSSLYKQRLEAKWLKNRCTWGFEVTTNFRGPGHVITGSVEDSRLVRRAVLVAYFGVIEIHEYTHLQI